MLILYIKMIHSSLILQPMSHFFGCQSNHEITCQAFAFTWNKLEIVQGEITSYVSQKHSINKTLCTISKPQQT